MTKQACNTFIAQDVFSPEGLLYNDMREVVVWILLGQSG